MQETFFSLLTSKKGRRVRDIRISLDKETLVAGAPWFSAERAKTLNVKAISSTK